MIRNLIINNPVDGMTISKKRAPDANNVIPFSASSPLTQRQKEIIKLFSDTLGLPASYIESQIKIK